MKGQTIDLLCCVMLLGIGLGVGGVLDRAAIAVAEEHPVDVNAPDAIRQTLEQ